MATLAVSGILAGCAPGGGGAGTPTIEIPKAIDAPDEPPAEPARRARSKNCCKGMNECKGKGWCKTDQNDCKGMNDCKGRGGCKPSDCDRR